MLKGCCSHKKTMEVVIFNFRMAKPVTCLTDYNFSGLKEHKFCPHTDTP